jgi:nucleotide-binding universal stress UspA family protein
MKTSSKARKSPRRPAPITGVLCGTDFSENARAAADVGAQLAHAWEQPLTLAHATVTPDSAAARSALSREAARLRKSSSAGILTRLIEGEPSDALAGRTAVGSTRLVVVSSLGERGPARWFLGSVAERTAEHATVPTLVVRKSEPFNAWLRGERSLRVFIAFNFTETSDAALRWVRSDLLPTRACELVLAHVNWPPQERARVGGAAPMPLEGNPAEVQRVLVRDLKARANELLGTDDFKVRIEPNWGRPDVRLADMAAEEGADLVVVGSHQSHGLQRLWHHSISRGLLERATASVAVVPTPPAARHGDGTVPWVWRVLTATDFSAIGDRAVAHAYALLPQGGVLRLVHVIPPGATSESQQAPAKPTARQAAQHRAYVESCQRRLATLIPAEAKERGVETEVTVLTADDAARELRQEAERFGADLVCLGTHGRSGVAKVLMGSTAQAVLASSVRPVLLVRPPAE